MTPKENSPDVEYLTYGMRRIETPHSQLVVIVLGSIEIELRLIPNVLFLPA